MTIIRKGITLIVLLCCAASLLCGCGAGAAVEEAKVMLDDYYDAFSSQDIDEAAVLIHEDLIAELGGGESLITRLTARRALLGEAEQHTQTGTAFEVSNGITEVTLNIKTEYSRGETLDETFVFTGADGEMSITGINFEEEAVTDDLAQKFFASFGDAQVMADLFIPALRNAQFAAQTESVMQQLTATAGEYQSNSFVGSHYDYYQIEGYDAYFVCLSAYTVHFSGMDMDFEFEYALQDDEIGLYYVSFEPSE